MPMLLNLRTSWDKITTWRRANMLSTYFVGSSIACTATLCAVVRKAFNPALALSLPTLAAAAAVLPGTRWKLWLLSRSIFKEMPARASIGAPENGSADESKLVVLMRHGESHGNVLILGYDCHYMKSIARGVKHMLNFFIKEARLLCTSDSVLLDPPLTDKGEIEAESLAFFMANMKAERAGCLAGSVSLCCSCLRRTAQTALIAFRPLLQSDPTLKIHVLSSLQEISDCADTVTLAQPGRVPNLQKWANRDTERELASRMEASGHEGQVWSSSSALEQWDKFAEWAFTQEESCVLAATHGNAIQRFFRTYLALPEQHRSPVPAESSSMDPRLLGDLLRKDRIPTASAVSCALKRRRANGKDVYFIDPDSVKFLHKGEKFIKTQMPTLLAAQEKEKAHKKA